MPCAAATTSFNQRLASAARRLWARAADFDADGADPAALCAPLKAEGLFLDALPESEGGVGLATAAQPLARALMMIGGADLAAGRILEGHVNAVKLVLRYGDAAQQHRLADAVRGGAVCGVWNAEIPPGLRLDPSPNGGGRLTGAKIYCSGVGLVSFPLVTAKTRDGAVVMLAVHLETSPTHDLSSWTMRGMRATATGTVQLTGTKIDRRDVLGQPGDYYQSPSFKGGAWRFAAVQTGAVLRLIMLMRTELCARGRENDPHQSARLGAATLAAETAELWIARACVFAEDATNDPAAVDAYVNLTRLAVERAALEVIQLVERSVGLSAFARPSPIERVVRDLSTYLRQPFPDGALQDAATFIVERKGEPPWSALAF